MSCDYYSGNAIVNDAFVDIQQKKSISQQRSFDLNTTLIAPYNCIYLCFALNSRNYNTN